MNDDATFAKFVRYFTGRLVQTLVQARLGTKIEQKCCAHPDQADWFNTRLDELGEISAYLKSHITEYPPACRHMSIEFLLCTADGKYLPLETWSISLEEETDDEINVASDLYHQMGTLLRSTALAARVTPMFRYFVKKQSSETFVILYRVYDGPSSTELGSDSKQIRMGQLPSPFGTLCLDLSYRVDMTIPSPSPSAEPVERPTHLKCRPSFSDCVPVQTATSMDKTSQLSNSDEQPSPVRTRFRIGRSSSSEDSQSINSVSETTEKETSPSVLFSPIRKTKRTLSFPFASLLEETEELRRRTISETVAPTFDVVDPSTSAISSNSLGIKAMWDDGDEIEDDRAPLSQFTPTQSRGENLGDFIRECRIAPKSLPSFSPAVSEDLCSELQKLSSLQSQFDDFVSSITKQGGEE